MLVNGDNLLAIHALNTDTNSSDFIINAELVGTNAMVSGELTDDAILYQQPIILNQSTQIKARTFFENEWSAKNERLFTIPEEIFDLTVSEIHYHPLAEDTSDEERDYEFIELKNRGKGILDLSDAEFSNGISFKFPAGAFIRPKSYIVLAADESKFLKRYGFKPFAVFEDNLNNAGERIVLRTVHQDTIFNLRYNDKAPWPETADGDGFSIVQIYPDSNLDINDGHNWRASSAIHGSPATEDITITKIENNNPLTVNGYFLSQNYPNPFNTTTMINYHLPGTSFVELTVYNVIGQEIARLVSKKQQSGDYAVTFDASPWVSGIYFYKIKTNSFVQVKKMLFLK